MRMTKTLLTALCVGLLTTTAPALAHDDDVISMPQSSNDDACGAALCLAGEMIGHGGGGKCQVYIHKYFVITVTSNGTFNPTKTAKKRMDFLKQCPSGDDSTQKRVNDRYGGATGL